MKSGLVRSRFPRQFEETVDSKFNKNIFIKFLNRIEGWKTRCKNLHWAAPTKDIHEYLDEFYEILNDFSDTFAEGYTGIIGKMNPTEVVPIHSNASDAMMFIEEVKKETISFYESVPEETIYKGLLAECDTLIYNITKYTLLFGMCRY